MSEEIPGGEGTTSPPPPVPSQEQSRRASFLGVRPLPGQPPAPLAPPSTAAASAASEASGRVAPPPQPQAPLPLASSSSTLPPPKPAAPQAPIASSDNNNTSSSPVNDPLPPRAPPAAPPTAAAAATTTTTKAPPAPPAAIDVATTSDQATKASMHADIAQEVIRALSSTQKARDEAQIEMLQGALKKALEEQREAFMTAAATAAAQNATHTSSNTSSRSSILSSDDAANGGALEAVKEVRDRQAKLISEIKEAHTRQMEILRGAIAEEREENSHAQKVFEQTLHIKYDHLVSALQEKVKAEHDARMQRALDDLEKSARVESERARQAFESQQAAEEAMSSKFRSIVGDLRKSWEDEEVARARQLEERLRGHYSAVLEHMEAQLQMALQLQDEADKQWMEDVEARNKQQVETLKSFEEKCRRVYDTRLAEYVDKTDQQMTQYEEQLLQVGSTLALERGRVESRQRRLKLACHRWKLEYQKDVNDRYRELAAALETRYMSEIQFLLEEKLKPGAGGLGGGGGEIGAVAVAGSSADSISSSQRRLSASNMRKELAEKWKEVDLTPEEQVAVLSELLDAAPVNAQMEAAFDLLKEKLSARSPILAMLQRKQFVEYKLKRPALAVGGGGGGATGEPLTLAGKAEFTQELNELQGKLEESLRKYEQYFGEKFVAPALLPTSAGSSGAGGGSGSATAAAASTSGVGSASPSASPSSARAPLGIGARKSAAGR